MSQRFASLRFPRCWFAAACVFGLGVLEVAAEKTDAWLMVRSDLQESIISSDVKEKAALEAQGWKVDAAGRIETEAVQGSGPLHRLARAGDGRTDRMLETDVKEIPELKEAGFTDEGVVGHVAAAAAQKEGGVAVVQYRKGEQRLWLASPETQAEAKAAGWEKQGVHFWLWPAG